MSAPYRVTLLQLKPDLSGAGAPSDRVDLGVKTPDEIFSLAGKLLEIKVPPQAKTEPAIIVQRGDRGWRIVAHSGLIRMHESTSPLDDYWTVDAPRGLAQLPPFRGGSSGPFANSRGQSRPPSSRRKHSVLRTFVEVAGLICVGVILLVVGLWYGVPHKHLRDVPDDVILIKSSDESESVFKSVAGTYVTGKKPGDGVIIISPQGQVMLGALDESGRPITPPRLSEEARAGRRNQSACVVTSFGIIAAGDADSVIVGNFKWKRTSVN
jgi:hypothetical protein